MEGGTNMNANELAEKIQFDVEPYIETDQFIFDECANMLRQQQAEIEAFKLQYYNTGYSLQLRDKDETIRQQQAEIELLKANMNTATKELLQKQDEIEALKGEVAYLKHINRNWAISEGLVLKEIDALKKHNGQLEFMVGYLEQEVYELKEHK